MNYTLHPKCSPLSQQGFAIIPLVVLMLFGISAGVLLIQNGVNFLPKAAVSISDTQCQAAMDGDPDYYYDNDRGRCEKANSTIICQRLHNSGYAFDGTRCIPSAFNPTSVTTETRCYLNSIRDQSSNTVRSCTNEGLICRELTAGNAQCYEPENGAHCMEVPQFGPGYTKIGGKCKAQDNFPFKYTCENNSVYQLVQSTDNPSRFIPNNGFKPINCDTHGQICREGGPDCFRPNNSAECREVFGSRFGSTFIVSGDGQQCIPADKQLGNEVSCDTSKVGPHFPLSCPRSDCENATRNLLYSRHIRTQAYCTWTECTCPNQQPVRTQDNADCSERKTCIYPEKDSAGKTYCYSGLCEHGQNCATNTLYEDGRCKYISECSINNYGGKKLGTRVACPTGTQNAAPAAASRPSQSAAQAQGQGAQPAAGTEAASRPVSTGCENFKDSEGTLSIPCYKIGVFTPDELKATEAQAKVALERYTQYKRILDETRKDVDEKIRIKAEEKIAEAERLAKACLARS